MYVSLLRGINVSGRNRLPMADLRALYERRGHDEVTTYVQSGNVVSSTPARSARAVGDAIQRAIADELGRDVLVLVRTPAQLGRILAANPFVRARADPKSLHVTFLAAAPRKAAISALDETAFTPDEFRVHGHEVYVSCPNGYGRTKINNSWFERKLGVAATTRNWKTVMQLSELAGT
jgi:uncharacterized protein (DUF1697 family)